MENILLWRNDPPTTNQKQAVRNMCHGWKIQRTRGLKTKGDYYDEIQRLMAVIAKIKLESHRSQGYGWVQPYSHYGDMQIDMDLGLCGQ